MQKFQIGHDEISSFLATSMCNHAPVIESELFHDSDVACQGHHACMHKILTEQAGMETADKSEAR